MVGRGLFKFPGYGSLFSSVPILQSYGRKDETVQNSWDTADPECQKRQIIALKSWEIVTEMNYPCSGGNG